MTRTSCLGTAKMHLFKYLFEKKGNPFVFLPSYCWTACQKINR